MSEEQSCAADIVYKQIDGGWHQYTVSLRPGQNYSWKDILADADSIAAADLSPIVNVQIMTAAGKAKELAAGEGKMFSIAGVSKSLDCPTIITWFNQLCVLGITTNELCGFGQILRYASTVAGERFDEAAAQAHSSDDFVIETGMLKKYTGNGGSVIIPNGVTSIGDRVFSGYKNLKSVTIPKRLEAAISHYKSIEKISYTDSADNSL